LFFFNLFSIAVAVFSDKVKTAVYRFPNSVSSLDVPCTACGNQHHIEFDVSLIATPYPG